MTKLNRMLLAGVVLLAPLSMAQAATVVQNSVVPWQHTEINTGPITLSGFDSSLGTLNSVEIQYYFGVESAGDLYNHGAQAANGRVNAGYAATLAFSGPSSIAGNYDFEVETGYINFAGIPVGGTVFFGPFTGSSSDTLNPADLASFIDTDFSYELSTLSYLTIQGGGGNLDSSIETWGDGWVRVTYDYTAAPPVTTVPEPAAWALLLAGFGLAGTSLRRRRDQHARASA